MEARSQLRHRPTRAGKTHLRSNEPFSFSTSKIDSSNLIKPFGVPLSLRTALAVLAPLSIALPLLAQAPATPMAAPSVAQARQQAGAVLADSLQQVSVTVDRLNRALGSVNVPKWKAPGDVRQTAEADVDSMQRDLSGTLPSLISAAQANTSKMSPAFAVYRNVDALYDVLLRV